MSCCSLLCSSAFCGRTVTRRLPRTRPQRLRKLQRRDRQVHLLQRDDMVPASLSCDREGGIMLTRSMCAAPATRMLPVIVALATLVACATNPATGKKEFSLMSEAQEIQLGQQMDGEIRREMGVYDDAELQRYVSDVGIRLAKASERPNLPWHFTVVDVPAVNAFALPGGYIYITRGILPFLHDEAQLAGVLGHEIGHVTARHSAQQYTQATTAGIGVTLLSIFVPEARPFQNLTETALGVLFLKHGREDEMEADNLGVRYTVATGWDPSGVAGMLRTLGRLDEASGS